MDGKGQHDEKILIYLHKNFNNWEILPTKIEKSRVYLQKKSTIGRFDQQEALKSTYICREFGKQEW